MAARAEEGGSLRGCAQTAAWPNRKGVPGVTSHSRDPPACVFSAAGGGGPPRVPAPHARPSLHGRPCALAQHYLLPSQPHPRLPSAPHSKAPAAPPFPPLADALLVGASARIGPNPRGGQGIGRTLAQCVPSALGLELWQGSTAAHRR